MAERYYSFEDETEEKGGDHLFLWTVFILLLIGMAFASWIGSFYIFGHPEKPEAYKLLKKLNKLEQPRRFEVIGAPTGEFLSPQRIYDRYAKLTPLQLEKENEELMRNYIKNYKETKKLVPYLTGRYEIIQSQALQPTDLFSSGVVALTSAEDLPQLLVEHVFTCAPEHVPTLKKYLPAGLDIRLEKTRDLAAVVHIERTPSGHIQLTAMPLLYGSWGVRGSVGVFSLEPPTELNLMAGAPIIREEGVQKALAAQAEARRGAPLPEPKGDAPENAPPTPELVRLDTVAPGQPVPATGAMPEVVTATPIPAGKPVAANAPNRVAPARGAATPAPLPPRATPAPRPVAAATPPPMVASAPVTEARPGVPLKPFVSSMAPNAPPAAEGGRWRTYAAGQQPRGRSITAGEAATLMGAPTGNEGRLYLRGNFVVTAAGESRAVLRSRGGETGGGAGGSARIIVEYPNSVAPPAEGAQFNRDESTGFEITDMRRGADGQMNIYVREVVQP